MNNVILKFILKEKKPCDSKLNDIVYSLWLKSLSFCALLFASKFISLLEHNE
jgi:hypothetical protein